ncbi:hypothetical protein CTAYLR_008822 [Chrysophaeum taylorii]|uniref:Plastid lipid-associated protein/fibrillin conserved domain-containing protein n=1 Tax=Chrysophaeum taylorii TaxID=2483200 RepID=A0AAD7UAC0_9STRA|nr:hypothetical protein CTAYLR_008822 [Chrysophaeum taylorii]
MLLLTLLAVTSALTPTVDRTIAARSRLVAALDNAREDREIVAAIDAIEAATPFKGFASEDFVSFAVAGDWQLDYATRRDSTNLTKSYVRVRDISQTVEKDASRTRVAWTLPTTGDAGTLEVRSTMRFQAEPRPHHVLRLDGHFLKPLHKLSAEPTDVVNHVAASVPYELFHPDRTVIELLYVDPELKILRCTRGTTDPVLTCQVWRRQ